MKTPLDSNGDTEIYKLFNKKSGNLLGLFTISHEVVGESFEFQGTQNTRAELTLNLKFIPFDDLNNHPYFSYFHASYLNNSYINKNARASISSHNPYSTGGIELNPPNIRGQRVGGFVMYRVIQWLQQYPLHTDVNPIDFVPSGDPNSAKKFYINAGIPVEGGSCTIGSLKLNTSWQQNIKRITKTALIHEIREMNCQLAYINEQQKIYKAQLRDMFDIQYTHNPLKAFKSKRIIPRKIEFENDVSIKNFQLPASTEKLIQLYVANRIHLEEKEQEVVRILKCFDEFNQYKHSKNRWRNLSTALMSSISLNKEVLIAILFILLTILYFL